MEELIVNKGDKQSVYTQILPQIESIISYEDDFIANLANVSAIIKDSFDLLWVGFYLVKSKRGESSLVLGPFQGPIACTRIGFGKGVCGSVWKEGSPLIVDDVESFPGHIACSSSSKSEIVIPLFNNGQIIGVLDIDSVKVANFDEIDLKYLTLVCDAICKNIK